MAREIRSMTQEEYAAAIAEFIRKKGVTRCPTACAWPTQGEVSAADQARLEEYWSAQERRREKKERRGFGGAAEE
jgi:hypothetical protein